MTADQKPKGFNRAKKKAESLLNNKGRLKRYLELAAKKAQAQRKRLGSVWDDFQTLLRLVKAWKKRTYKKVPWRSIVYATTAIIYLVNPLDLIPDFIIGIGLIDDLGIITFVIKSIRKDIDAFQLWEKGLPAAELEEEEPK